MRQLLVIVELTLRGDQGELECPWAVLLKPVFCPFADEKAAVHIGPEEVGALISTDYLQVLRGSLLFTLSSMRKASLPAT